MEQTLPAISLNKRATATASLLGRLLPEELQHPLIAIVCGSGLGGLAETIHPSPKLELPYEEIPGFPASTVQGHAGKLVFGLMGETKTPVVLFVGRAHFYEGHSMPIVTFATRVCKRLGIEHMIATNAAGGLNMSYNVGDIVVVNDHINIAGFVGNSPLRGPNEDEFGVRFPPMSDAYDLVLRRHAHRIWAKLGSIVANKKLHEGVYAFVAGPSYETRAECRLLQAMGADLVGMSTVPEVVVARHSGIKVLAFSLVTNKCMVDAPVPGNHPDLQSLHASELTALMAAGSANHEEVLASGREAAKVMQAFVVKIVEGLDSKLDI